MQITIVNAQEKRKGISEAPLCLKTILGVTFR